MLWDFLKHNLGCLELNLFQNFMFKLMLLKLWLDFVPLRKDWALIKVGRKYEEKKIYTVSRLSYLVTMVNRSKLREEVTFIFLVKWQKSESQNGGNKNTNHAKFFEKQTFFTS